MDKIGVYLCSSKSAVYPRHTVCQMLLQTEVPAAIAIHQNGSLSNYQWAFTDIIPKHIETYFRYTSGIVKEPFFYLTPLLALYEMGCTHFVKVDDDDIFYSNHIKTLYNYFLNDSSIDIVTPKYGDVLEPTLPRLTNLDWEWNPTRAMSDSVMFNRAFAKSYISLLKTGGDDTIGRFDDCLMGVVIRSGDFTVIRPEHDATACYVINGLNTSGDLRGNQAYKPQREAKLREKMNITKGLN